MTYFKTGKKQIAIYSLNKEIYGAIGFLLF